MRRNHLILLGLAYYFFVYKKDEGAKSAAVTPAPARSPQAFATAEDLNKAINPFA